MNQYQYKQNYHTKPKNVQTITINHFFLVNLKFRDILEHLRLIKFEMLARKEGKKRTYLTDTFESQIYDEKGSRFMMDRTLYKGIKENDVSKIIDVSKEGGQLGEKAFPSEEQQLSHLVIQMRRKYDQIRTQTVQLQSALQKHRKAAQTLKSEETRLQDYLSSAKSNLQNAQKQHDSLFDTVQARVYDMDIYKQAIKTLKHDILIIKKRNFDKDLRLKQQKAKVKSLRVNQFNKTQLSYKCRDMLQSIEKVVISKQQERTAKINTFYDALNRKHENLRKRQDRDRQIEEVMMKAMSQKLQQQKEWINISYVNLFLKKFLKCKMERLIEENSEVEGAYHKIRSNTDIKDCKDLITRFLNREKDYGILLNSISEKQALLESLKQQKQVLQKANFEHIQNSQQINESVHKSSDSSGNLHKELQWFEQNLKNIEQKNQLMNKWCIKFFCSFNSKTRDQVLQKYSNKTPIQLMKAVLLQISKYLTDILGDQNNSGSINNAFMSTRPTDKTFDDQMVNRNKRVKTTAAQDSFIEGEDKDAIYDGNSQADFLYYNRRMTKKNDQTRRFRIKTQLK